MIAIIVAYNKNFVIGDKDGKIPWKISEEMQHFKRTTMGSPVIMGRKTWDSIPKRFKPLKERINIVLSRSPLEHMEVVDDEEVPAVRWFDDLLNAVHHAEREKTGKPIFIIGGEQVYNEAIEKEIVDRVIASEVKGHTKVEGAAFFPDLRKQDWNVETTSKHKEFTIVNFLKP